MLIDGTIVPAVFDLPKATVWDITDRVILKPLGDYDDRPLEPSNDNEPRHNDSYRYLNQQQQQEQSVGGDEVATGELLLPAADWTRDPGSPSRRPHLLSKDEPQQSKDTPAMWGRHRLNTSSSSSSMHHFMAQQPDTLADGKLEDKARQLAMPKQEIKEPMPNGFG